MDRVLRPAKLKADSNAFDSKQVFSIGEKSSKGLPQPLRMFAMLMILRDINTDY